MRVSLSNSKTTYTYKNKKSKLEVSFNKITCKLDVFLIFHENSKLKNWEISNLRVILFDI